MDKKALLKGFLASTERRYAFQQPPTKANSISKIILQNLFCARLGHVR